MRKLILIAAALVILMVIAVPVLAATNPENKAAEEFVEALGFDDVPEFRAFFGLEEGKGDYADSSSSKDADALAEQLDYDGGDALAHALGLRNEEELEAYLEEFGDLDEFAQALGYTNAIQLARDLGSNRGELARVLGFEDDNVGSTDEVASTADVAGTGGSHDSSHGSSVSQSFEQEDVESGDVEPSVSITNTGDNSNLCPTVLQSANSGNVQNAQGVTQYSSTSDDIEFEGSTITITPELVAECEQTIQQAAAAGGSAE